MEYYASFKKKKKRKVSAHLQYKSGNNKSKYSVEWYAKYVFSVKRREKMNLQSSFICTKKFRGGGNK